jgi:hypothetical protein
LHSYCQRINLLDMFLSYFQCRSLLKILILMQVVKSVISCENLNIHYNFLPQTTFLCGVNYVYFKTYNVKYLLNIDWKQSTFGAYIMSFLLYNSYVYINLNTQGKEINLYSKSTYIFNRMVSVREYNFYPKTPYNLN